MKKVVFTLFALLFVSSLQVNVAFAKDAAVASDSEVVVGKMDLINKGGDPKVVSAAVQALGDYKYKQVLDFMIRNLEKEVQKDKPNTYIISAYLDGIQSMGTASAINEFTRSYEIFKSIESKLGAAGVKIEKKFYDTREAIRLTKGDLPVLADLASAQGYFEDQLKKDATGINGPEKADIAKVILAVMVESMTDQVKISRAKNDFLEIIGRDEETARGVDVLARIKGKNPVFLGIPGVGKTAAAERMAQIIVDKLYPNTEPFREAFENAEMLKITPARLSRIAKSNDANSMAEAVEKFFDAVYAYEQSYAKEHNGQRKPILVFVDEMHNLSDAQTEALLPYLDAKTKGIRILGASNSDKFQITFKNNEAFLRRVEQIGLAEFDEATTIKILNASWVPVIEKKYNVKFGANTVETAVKLGPVLKPDTARPDGPFKILQDMAVNTNRANNGKLTQIQDKDIYNFAKTITGLPVNPHDGKEFNDYLAKLEADINDVVVEQNQMVHKVLGRFGNLLIGEPKRPQIIGMIGTTGTGKTLLGETFAEKAFGNKSRVLVIDGNAYQTGGFSLGTLIGAPNGVISSDKKSGILCEWLDDPSRGKMGGVIVINEAEKMHPDAWKRLMEFFDKGTITGGDGKTRHANRHMVILTSNRGAKIVFPDNVTMWSQDEINRRVANLTSKDIADLFKQKVDGKDEFQLAPEVLGRIDEWMIANPGSAEGAQEVANRELQKLQREMEDQYHLTLKVSPEVVKHLALTGFSVSEGYRFVAKQVESYVKASIKEGRKWNIPRGGSLSIGLQKKENSKEVKLVITNDQTKEQALVDAPEQKFYNPLQDKAVTDKIKEMPKKMKTRIIGQDAAVQSTADAVLAKYADVGRRSAVSFAIVGPTGVGKTELGRAIAEALYGSPDRVEIIPLGDVNFEGKLNDIFASPSGYVGSEKIGKFERALMNTPNGGVIVFDEFSNMGGGDPVKKGELLKQYFYQITDEGTWTSTVTGKTYDLRYHVFEFTGNDMQELFQGLNNDDMRLQIYKENNNKEKIRSALVKSGIPEAFLGRMADVILAKPLLSTEMYGVTEKLLNEQIKRLQNQHKGLKIEYDKKFIDDFTRGFFTPDTGGRSVKSALDNRLGSLIGGALVELGEAGQDLSKYTFKLSVKDNLTSKPYINKNSEPRKVLIGIQVYKDGKKIHAVEKDFTEFAPKPEIPLYKHAELVAYHEAGHAVVNVPELTNETLDFITIRSSTFRDSSGRLMVAKGYARYKDIPGADTNLTYERTVAIAARAWAGRISQELAGFQPDIGWMNDREQMQRVTSVYLSTLDSDLLGVKLDEKYQPILKGKMYDLFIQKQNALMEEGRRIAEEIVKDRWALVRSIVANIMKTGDIAAERATELADQTEDRVAEEKVARAKIAELIKAHKAQVKDGKYRPIISFADWQDRRTRQSNSRSKPTRQKCGSLMERLIADGKKAK